jgi:hypothetical protein
MEVFEIPQIELLDLGTRRPTLAIEPSISPWIVCPSGTVSLHAARPTPSCAGPDRRYGWPCFLRTLPCARLRQATAERNNGRSEPSPDVDNGRRAEDLIVSAPVAVLPPPSPLDRGRVDQLRWRSKKTKQNGKGSVCRGTREPARWFKRAWRRAGEYVADLISR